MARLIDPGQQHPRLEAAMVCAGAATGMALMAAAARAGVGSLLEPAGPPLMGAYTDALGRLEAAIREAAAQSVGRAAATKLLKKTRRDYDATTHAAGGAEATA